MENNTSKPLLLGWAETDMTPYGRRIMLEGEFFERISQSVETPITATALAVESQGEQLVICSTDNTMMYKYVAQKIRELVGKECPDLDTDKIIIHATHTHNSFEPHNPDAKGSTLEALATQMGLQTSCEGEGNIERDGLMTPDEVYEWETSKIADAIIRAWKNRKPGFYAESFGRVAVGMNRRVTYTDGTAKMWGDAYRDDFFALEGGNDNGMELIFVYDENKKMTGAVVNIACPSQVMEQRYQISSDYWGKLRIFLREQLGEDFKVLGLCSPAGDLCPRDLIRWVEPETKIEDPNVIRDNPPEHRADPSMYDVAGTWRIGRRIFNEIMDILKYEPLELKSEAVLKHKPMILDLPLRLVTEEEYQDAYQHLMDFVQQNHGKDVDFKETAAMHVYAGIYARHELQKKERVVPTEVHVVRFDDVAIASNPFELFMDFANIIRARSVAKQTFLIQLSNDALGYLPTEKAEKGGHYSAYVSSGYVGHEGGYQMVETVLNEIREMFK